VAVNVKVVPVLEPCRVVGAVPGSDTWKQSVSAPAAASVREVTLTCDGATLAAPARAVPAHVVVLPLPGSAEEEVAIIVKRGGEMAQSLDLPAPRNVAEEVARVVAIFRELRAGSTEDGKVALKSPSGGLSTAEAIGVMVGGISQATFFNDGRLTPGTLAATMIGAVVKDPVQDKAVLGEYLETVLKKRRGFEDYYASLSELI